MIQTVSDSGLAVFTLRQIGDLLGQLSEPLPISSRLAVSFLVERRILTKTTLISIAKRKITRYTRPQASPFQLALSLTNRGYLSHGAALYLNGLAKSPPRAIHVNEEQSAKPRSTMAPSQATIDRAFKGKQRSSKREFLYQRQRIVILNGKQSGRLGTGELLGARGERLATTLPARTLVDVVVRPDYAGGPTEILKAYKQAAGKVSVDEIVATLKQLDYVYPYHQAIGFYLERAGVPAERLQPLKALGLNFDFYLGYGLENPAYDARWRVFVPRDLTTT
jgi:predicted transcriptional regulator of viral defense system